MIRSFRSPSRQMKARYRVASMGGRLMSTGWMPFSRSMVTVWRSFSRKAGSSVRG